jgi:hypothetical protein
MAICSRTVNITLLPIDLAISGLGRGGSLRPTCFQNAEIFTVDNVLTGKALKRTAELFCG